jgi:hypothetical protein
MNRAEHFLVRTGRAIHRPSLLATTLHGVAPPSARPRDIQEYDAALRRLANVVTGGDGMDATELVTHAANEIQRLRAVNPLFAPTREELARAHAVIIQQDTTIARRDQRIAELEERIRELGGTTALQSIGYTFDPERPIKDLRRRKQ